MTPNERLTPDSACTCAEGKGCPLHATGMTPDRERLLRQFHGSYFGKDEMWAEIDYLRQQLAAKDAVIERRYSDAMIGHRWFETRFGESFNGRDFAVKCPMADEALAEQERDMRQMVEALKDALPWAISGGASKERESAVIATRAALALPSAQRLKKGD